MVRLRTESERAFLMLSIAHVKQKRPRLEEPEAFLDGFVLHGDLGREPFVASSRRASPSWRGDPWDPVQLQTQPFGLREALRR